MKKDRLLLFLLFLPLLTFAQQDFKLVSDPTAVSKKISETARNIHSIESDFVQEKNLSVIAEKIVSKGHFSFKKENKLRWEYKEPFQYLVILNNGKIFTKDANKENKIDLQSNKTFQEINNLIVNSVEGNISASKRFSYKIFENSTFYLIKLIPTSKDVKNLFAEIEIYFDKKDQTVSKVNMIEASGDNTLITFLNRKTNLEIPDEKFSTK